MSSSHRQLTSSLSTFIFEGKLHLRDIFLLNSIAATSVDSIIIPATPFLYMLVWPHSPERKLTTKHAFAFLHQHPLALDWASTIWHPCIPPSHSFIYWRLMHCKLPTDENLRSQGCLIVSICVFCYASDEISTHLFLSCDFECYLWHWFGRKLNFTADFSSIASLLHCISARCSSQVRDVCVAAIIHGSHNMDGS